MTKPQPFWNHFGLTRNPFGNIGSADDVFESREISKIMERLFEAVEEGGIHAVTGERGIGKTTAKNEILNYFEENRNRFVYSVLECMDLQKVTMSTILSAILADLKPSEPVKRGAEQKARQVRRILGELAGDKKVVLVVDEAQRLPIETLERLKMLTEMKWGFRSKLITVLLVGQSELNYKLSRDEGLMLRVTQYRMAGLNEDEILQYIDLRCRTAGGKMTDVFSEDALTYMAENLHSPLHVNHTCASSMRLARHAGEKKVNLQIIYESGGIRTPRQILRDNNISLRAFARMIQLHEERVTKLLDGNTEGTNAEQRDKFRNGLSTIMRGKQDGPEAERKVS